MKKFKLLGVLLCALTFGIFSVEVNALTLTADSFKDGKYTVEDKDITGEDFLYIKDAGDKEVVVDLNNHTFTTAKQGYTVYVSNSKVVITNGKIVNTNSNGGSGITVNTSSTLTVKNVDINVVDAGVVVGPKATFTFDGGTITTDDNFAIGGDGTEGKGDYTINFKNGTINAGIKTANYISCGIYHPNKGTVNVTGGVINSSNGAGIVQRGGTLNITGGEINVNGTTAGWVGDSKNKVEPTDVYVDKAANYPDAANIVTNIKGGVYTSKPANVPEGYSAYNVLEGENAGKFVVANEDELSTKAIAESVKKEDVSKEDVTLIEKEVKDKYTLAGYYDVDLAIVTKNGDVVDYATTSEKGVKVTLTVPTTLDKVKEGFVRKYYVIRVHEGKTTVISDVTDNGNGTVSFTSDKFSSYALAYKDVENKSVVPPKTFDGIITYIAIALVGAGLVVYTSLYLKKRMN